MDAPRGREERKELDPRAAGELQRRPAREGSAPEQAGHGPAQTPDRAEPRDDAVEDGG